MFKQLLISTAISTVLISTPLLAESSSKSSDNPQTTGQQSSPANDAGGQASTSGETSGADMDFDELDQNKDGQLDEDELNRFGATAAGGTDTEGDKDQSERMLKMYDHDDDGSISKQEMEAGARSMDE